MKKRSSLLLSIVIICVAATVGVVGAYAAGWFGTFTTEENTVTIGHPLNVSISGMMDETGIMPGQSVSQDFTLDLRDANFTENTYALVLKDIVFNEGTFTFGEAVAVWQFKFNGGEFADLTSTGGNIALANKEVDLVTLTLTLNENIPVSLAGEALTFVLEIVETPNGG